MLTIPSNRKAKQIAWAMGEGKLAIDKMLSELQREMRNLVEDMDIASNPDEYKGALNSIIANAIEQRDGMTGWDILTEIAQEAKKIEDNNETK